MWPISEGELFGKAQAVVLKQGASEEALFEAEPLLESYRSRFPEGTHATQVGEWLGDIEGIRAERLLSRRLTLGKEPETEAEKLWIEAQTYEKFGDRLTALEKYSGMQTILKADESARPFRNLARRREAAIRKEIGGETDRATFINGKLAAADQLLRDGKTSEARQLWESIEKLYGSNPEFRTQADRARARLRNPESARSPAS
jgi:hypothetical protein